MRAFYSVKYILVCSVVSALVIGCATIVDVTPLGELPTLPPTSNVEIFTSRDAVKRNYKELAIISVDDEGWEKRDSTLMRDMTKKAKQLGADGIILLPGESHSDGGIFVSTVYAEGRRKVMKGIAIIFEDNTSKSLK